MTQLIEMCQDINAIIDDVIDIGMLLRFKSLLLVFQKFDVIVYRQNQY